VSQHSITEADVALAVLPNPIQIVAEAWGFKSQDIRRANDIAVTIVYDAARAKDVSKTILQKMADFSVPSNAVEDLGNVLARAGIPARKTSE
jgi:hypothetical protein